MSALHVFDSAIQLQATRENHYTGIPSPAYANMVSPFGGITSATLLNALLQHPSIKGTPLSFTVNFAAPIKDAAFEVTVQLMHETRSTQHWFVSLKQGDDVCNTATAVFASRRDTWQATDLAFPKDVQDPTTLPRAPTEGRPIWVQRYDMRFECGALLAFDGQEQPNARSLFWIRDEPPRALSFTSLQAICDAFFPRIFLRRHAPTPAGTVSMTTYFHVDQVTLAQVGDAHLLADARANTYQKNFSDQSAEVWSDNGQLLATTHQIVYFKA